MLHNPSIPKEFFDLPLVRDKLQAEHDLNCFDGNRNPKYNIWEDWKLLSGDPKLVASQVADTIPSSRNISVVGWDFNAISANKFGYVEERARQYEKTDSAVWENLLSEDGAHLIRPLAELIFLYY